MAEKFTSARQFDEFGSIVFFELRHLGVEKNPTYITLHDARLSSCRIPKPGLAIIDVWLPWSDKNIAEFFTNLLDLAIDVDQTKVYLSLYENSIFIAIA